MYEAIVIGAGPAGLQAALTLGRMHVPTLLLDSGEYRNGTVRHMHNLVGADGMPPTEFRATAREELARYADVDVRDIAAERVSGAAGDFSVRLADGSEARGRRIVLATGVADALPAVPGLDALWGVRAFSCPFCDGHEFEGRPIAILAQAARAEHLISLLGRFVGDVTVFPVGSAFADEERQMLEHRGARVSAAPVDEVAAEGDGVRVTAGGEPWDAAGVFVAGGEVRQRAPFAAQLELRMLPSGAIEIDDLGATSMPGVWAAGDLAHRASLPGLMAAVAQAVAAGQLAAIGIVRDVAS